MRQRRSRRSRHKRCRSRSRAPKGANLAEYLLSSPSSLLPLALEPQSASGAPMLSRFGVDLGVNSGVPPINSLLVSTSTLFHSCQRVVVLIYVAIDRVVAWDFHDVSFGPCHFSPSPIAPRSVSDCLVPNLRRLKPDCAVVVVMREGGFTPPEQTIMDSGHPQVEARTRLGFDQLGHCAAAAICCPNPCRTAIDSWRGHQLECACRAEGAEHSVQPLVLCGGVT